MPKLTDINSSSVTLTDLVHIARDYQNCGNDCQSYYGSSYKATMGQVLSAGGCCLSAGTYDLETNTLSFQGIGGNIYIPFPNNFVIFTGGSNSCITNMYLNSILPCTATSSNNILKFQPNVGVGISPGNTNKQLKWNILAPNIIPSNGTNNFNYNTIIGPVSVIGGNLWKNFVIQHFYQLQKNNGRVPGVSTIGNPSTRLILNIQLSNNFRNITDTLNGRSTDITCIDFLSSKSTSQTSGPRFRFEETSIEDTYRYLSKKNIVLDAGDDRANLVTSFKTNNSTDIGIEFGSVGNPTDTTPSIKDRYASDVLTAFISKTENSNGLNIISLNGPITFRPGIQSFVAFSGQTVSYPPNDLGVFDPKIVICGSGTTKGYIGLGMKKDSSTQKFSANWSPTSLIDIIIDSQVFS